MSGRKQGADNISDEEVDGDNENRNNGYDTDEEGGLRIDDEIYIPPPPSNFGEIDTKGPRLMITKIVNINFKSYAGKRIIGPFHKCFSAIVGPNGSGKSNVIDSMLFVFGYRASKIRSKKISVLIHNSSQHPNCKSCTVAVHFQQIIDKPGTDDYDIVPNSQFSISRTAFKDSTSYYEINDKKVQFKHIAKLLRSHAVDLDHNRFLILQGEVEQIALMKPKGQNEGDTGMLEFLEDIIGTSRYKQPLEKLFEKVELLSELRHEKLTRLKVAEKAKEDLEEPMQDAIEYLRIENSITKLQHKYYQCKRYETQQQIVQEEEKKNELNEDHTKLVEEMKVVTEKKEEKSKELKEKSKKWEKLQQQKDTLTAKFDEARKKDEALHAESVATNKRRKENMATVKTEKTKLEELKRVPEKNTKDIEECEHLQNKHIVDLETEEAALVTLMSGLKEKTEPLIAQRSKLEKELISLRKNVDEAKSVFDIAESKLHLYTSEEKTEQAKLEQLQQSLKTTSETLQERKKQLGAFVSKIPATEKSLQEAQKDLNEIKARENEVNERLKNTRVSFEEKRSAMHASTSRNRVIDALMKQKREGKLPGIFGRLGDLGGIDPKFDVAISTACGPLDNVVVDTTTTAQDCIKFLRDHDIGRATFIPLDKQQRFAQQCREKIRTPENVHRLFDLIEVKDERVLPAFFYAIQNTLVANDLEQATRIAYGSQRYRVVTLKGELIELSGTMSGGGRTVSRGRMGKTAVRSEPTADEIACLQKKLDDDFAECQQLRMKQQPLENQIYTLSTALKDMIMDRDKFTVEIRGLGEQEPLLRKQLMVQEKKASETVSDPAKVKEMTKAVEAAKKNLDAVENNSQATEKEVTRINQEIEEISGGRVKEQQKKITHLKKSIDKTKAEIVRLQVAIKTSERNAKKTEQRIETLENDVRNCEQRIRDIISEKSELEVVAKSYMDEIKELNEALVERDETTSSLRKELEKMQARESKMKSLKIDLDQKVNEHSKLLKELQRRVPDLTRAIQNLKLQNIPLQPPQELKELTDEELAELESKAISSLLQKAKERLPEQIPNMQIIKDYQEQNEVYLKRAEELQKMTEERNKLREIYDMARRRRLQEFHSGFSLITGKLKEMYQMITLGGDAELELVDTLDPFSEGIVFSVRPPKKSWKNIQNLSGGEKTLSSLALVFALHHYKPTPLYFMDEIDAALDFKNVSIVGNYIKERTKNAQFIVISLRSNMFELADYLVGIYKTFNCTKSATLFLGKYYDKYGHPPPSQNQSRPQIHQSQPITKVTNTQVLEETAKTNSLMPRQLQFPATCPAEIRHEEDKGAGDKGQSVRRQSTELTNDGLFRLPVLDLLPTPLKSSGRPKPGKKAEVAATDDPEPSVDAPIVDTPKTKEKTSRPAKATRLSSSQETPLTRSSSDQEMPRTRSSLSQEMPRTRSSLSQEMPRTRSSLSQETPKTRSSLSREMPRTRSSLSQEKIVVVAQETSRPARARATPKATAKATPRATPRATSRETPRETLRRAAKTARSTTETPQQSDDETPRRPLRSAKKKMISDSPEDSSVRKRRRH